MLLPLTEDRFEIDEFYGLDKYPLTTSICADNMLVFNYMAKYWIMNGSTLIGSSSTNLTEYYENYKDKVVQNGSVVLLEGDLPRPRDVPVLYMIKRGGWGNIISKMISDKFVEQTMGLVGMHTHDTVSLHREHRERRRKIFWDDLPRTTWKSEQEEPRNTTGELLTSGKNCIIVGRKTAITRAIKIRSKSIDKGIIRFGEDAEELGSLEEYMEFLSGDNLNNNCHVIIPNLYEILRNYYRSKVVDEYSGEEYGMILNMEATELEIQEMKVVGKQLATMKRDTLREDYKFSSLRVIKHRGRKRMKEVEERVKKFVLDKRKGNHDGYPELSFMGVKEKIEEMLGILDKIYQERGIVVTFTLPTAGIKVTRKMRVFHKRMEGYQGAIDDLVLSILDRCLFVFNDLGDMMVTDFIRIVNY